jgi:tetratricopeptide (TPR) repeat protein
MAAGAALARNDLDKADPLLKDWLAANPDDIYALRMLAELFGRLGRYRDSEKLLARALAIAPAFDAARFNYALVLHRQSRTEAAIVEVDRLLEANPGHPGYRNLKAAMCARLGNYAEAIDIYTALLADHPDNPRGHMSFGHALKTVGRRADCEAAYRAAVARAPTLGEAWWSLANLKTFRFTDADLAAIRAALARRDLGPEDRLHLDFALGKALEDRGEFEASFHHYAAGNRGRRTQVNWDGAANRAHAAAVAGLFDAGYFAARAGQGCPAADPIFVVGLPRSGSTLIEQILASHSQVEGTMELPDMAQLARDLAEKAFQKQRAGERPRASDTRERDPIVYLDELAVAAPEELAAIGAAYVERTRIHRKTDRPRFVDKMPNNFALVAMIQLVLPNAIIIDARRHAMATCFSAWKQHFARGQTFTYDLRELGEYYRDYIGLMDHFDRALPGRVLRVWHERLVMDTEAEVRRILDHCGLDYEAGVLDFHRNRRPVRTASSEQVRQPIFTEGLEQWRHYAPWLDDLKATLGPELANMALL